MIAPSLPYFIDGIPKARDDVAQIDLLVSNQNHAMTLSAAYCLRGMLVLTGIDEVVRFRPEPGFRVTRA